MTDSVEQTPARESRRRQLTLTGLFVDLADTTWRMFIPTVGLLLAGRYCDTRFGTKPWLMLVGVLVGGVLAGLLIKQQIARGYDK
jgi:hypothetical protein